MQTGSTRFEQRKACLRVGSSIFHHRLQQHLSQQHLNISKRRNALPRLPVVVQRRRVLILVPHPRTLVGVLAFVKVVPWGCQAVHEVVVGNEKMDRQTDRHVVPRNAKVKKRRGAVVRLDQIRQHKTFWGWKLFSLKQSASHGLIENTECKTAPKAMGLCINTLPTSTMKCSVVLRPKFIRMTRKCTFSPSSRLAGGGGVAVAAIPSKA